MNTYIQLSNNNAVISQTTGSNPVIAEGIIILEGWQNVTHKAYDEVTEEFYAVKYNETGILLLNENGKAVEDLTIQRIKPKQLGE